MKITNNADIVTRAGMWVIGNDTGISSKVIWAVMMGLRPSRLNAPSDPADLGRCLRLLEAIPEWKPRIAEIAAVFVEWARLVAFWDKLAACMAAEAGTDWSKGREARRTYEFMKLVLDGQIA